MDKTAVIFQHRANEIGGQPRIVTRPAPRFDQPRRSFHPPHRRVGARRRRLRRAAARQVAVHIIRLSHAASPRRIWRARHTMRHDVRGPRNLARLCGAERRNRAAVETQFAPARNQRTGSWLRATAISPLGLDHHPLRVAIVAPTSANRAPGEVGQPRSPIRRPRASCRTRAPPGSARCANLPAARAGPHSQVHTIGLPFHGAVRRSAFTDLSALRFRQPLQLRPYHLRPGTQPLRVQLFVGGRPFVRRAVTRCLSTSADRRPRERPSGASPCGIRLISIASTSCCVGT